MVRRPRADIMQPRSTASDSTTQRHRPKTLTVFAAAFAAGAVLAYGVDRVVDVHVVQVEPQVESEPIFVALRSLPQGAPITVWDVALKDWPKAMLPTTALKADASFEGMVLRHPIREGQPLLSVQLVRDGATLPTMTVATLPPATAPTAAPAVAPQPAALASPPIVPVEQFVPAMPAEPSSATALVEPAAGGAEVSRVEVGPAAVHPVATPPAAPGVTAVADADIDADITADIAAAESANEAADVPRDVSVEQVPQAVATAEVRPADAVTTAPADGPALVAIGRLFAAGTGAAPAAEPTLAVAEPAASSAEVPPLAAPVPNLPTTDIEQSLSAFSRRGSQPDAPTESVLDRTATEPPPPPARSASTPRYHLVVPERIALAADSSFVQQSEPSSTPTTPPAVAVPRQQAAGAASSTGSRRPGPTTATNRNVQPQGSAAAMRPSQTTTRQQVAKPSATRQAAAKSGASKQAAASRGGRPAAKSAATPTPDKAATPAGRGLGAWFPQFSGGSWQR